MGGTVTWGWHAEPSPTGLRSHLALQRGGTFAERWGTAGRALARGATGCESRAGSGQALPSPLSRPRESGGALAVALLLLAFLLVGLLVCLVGRLGLFALRSLVLPTEGDRRGGTHRGQW